MAEEEAQQAPAEGAPASAEGEDPIATSDEGGVTKAEDWQPRKLQLYKHWVRPKFLQYRYMYDYRYNYYDDVLDYLDKRQKGITSEIPRPQYWAERVIRTRQKTEAGESGYSHYASDAKRREDRRLIHVLSNQINSHNYHSRGYLGVKYSRLL